MYRRFPFPSYPPLPPSRSSLLPLPSPFPCQGHSSRAWSAQSHLYHTYVFPPGFSVLLPSYGGIDQHLYFTMKQMKKHELVHYSLSDFAKFFSSFSSVIEVNESYEGCVNGSNISNPQTVTMKAHEASPSKCIEICRERKSQWAYVRERSCKCSNSSQTSSKLIEKCNKRCWSNSSLVCGGDGDDAFSAYKTGKSVIYHHMFSMFPAGRMHPTGCNSYRISIELFLYHLSYGGSMTIQI